MVSVVEPKQDGKYLVKMLLITLLLPQEVPSMKSDFVGVTT
jgi:hypothetical protein